MAQGVEHNLHAPAAAQQPRRHYLTLIQWAQQLMRDVLDFQQLYAEPTLRSPHFGAIHRFASKLRSDTKTAYAAPTSVHRMPLHSKSWYKL